jgi:hypothetical protein
MSDTSQGPDWWLATDGRWYPPERHPNYVPPVASSVQPHQPSQELAAYQGLAPGWYRDVTAPDLARYWDGVTLSQETRPVAPPAPPPPPANPSAGTAAFSPMSPPTSPGWYEETEYESPSRLDFLKTMSPLMVAAVACALIGVVAGIVAIVYFTVPAHSLPSILGSLPKKLASRASERKIHRVHRGEAAAGLAVVLLVVAGILAFASNRSRGRTGYY